MEGSKLQMQAWKNGVAYERKATAIARDKPPMPYTQMYGSAVAALSSFPYSTSRDWGLQDRIPASGIPSVGRASKLPIVAISWSTGGVTMPQPATLASRTPRPRRHYHRRLWCTTRGSCTARVPHGRNYRRACHPETCLRCHLCARGRHRRRLSRSSWMTGWYV